MSDTKLLNSHPDLCTTYDSKIRREEDTVHSSLRNNSSVRHGLWVKFSPIIKKTWDQEVEGLNPILDKLFLSAKDSTIGILIRCVFFRRNYIYVLFFCFLTYLSLNQLCPSFSFLQHLYSMSCSKNSHKWNCRLLFIMIIYPKQVQLLFL